MLFVGAYLRIYLHLPNLLPIPTPTYLYLPIPTYLPLSTYTPIKHKIQTGIFCDNKMNVFAQTWSIIDTHTHSCLLVNRVTR